MDGIVEIIGQLGFPIAVAAYALWNSYKHEQYLQETLDKTLKENTEALDKLGDLIENYIHK